MRIAMISPLFPPERIGGIEKHVAELVRGLAERGHRVDLLCGSLSRCEQDSYDRVDEQFALHGVRIFRGATISEPDPVAETQKLNEQLVATWQSYLRQCGEPDIVHGHDVFTIGVCEDAIRLGIPTFTTLHFCQMAAERSTNALIDFDHMKPKDSYFAGLQSQLATLPFKQFFVVGSTLKSEVRELLNVERSRMQVVHNGLLDYPEELAPRQTAAERGSPTRFLVLGRLSRKKGIGNLLRQLPGMAKCLEFQRRMLVLRFVGDGSYRERLQEAIAPLAPYVRVEITPFSMIEDVVKEHLQWADYCLWMPLYDTCSYTVIEAFAAGTPVIAARVGAIGYYLRHGENAMIIDGREPGAVAAVLRDLHNNTLLWHRLRRGGFETLKHFSFRDTVATIEDCYEQALGGLGENRAGERSTGAHRLVQTGA